MMGQSSLNPNSTNKDVTDTEILSFYNLATMTLLRTLEVIENGNSPIIKMALTSMT